MWEDAIQPIVPWFELAFVEKDPSAPVQIVWKSRIIGPWGGFGGVRHWVEGTELRVGGVMELSTTPYGSLGPDARLDLDEIRLLIAHEFGHAAGNTVTLGRGDEYRAGHAHFGDQGSIMHSGNQLRSRHFRTILDVMNGMIPDTRFSVGSV